MEEKRILLVDDEESILLAFKKLLQRPFVQVDTCESMEEAIYNIDHFSYDAVIADLRLSGSLGQEGFQIVSYLKKRHLMLRRHLSLHLGSIVPKRLR